MLHKRILSDKRRDHFLKYPTLVHKCEGVDITEALRDLYLPIDLETSLEEVGEWADCWREWNKEHRTKADAIASINHFLLNSLTGDFLITTFHDYLILNNGMVDHSGAKACYEKVGWNDPTPEDEYAEVLVAYCPESFKIYDMVCSVRNNGFKLNGIEVRPYLSEEGRKVVKEMEKELEELKKEQR